MSTSFNTSKSAQGGFNLNNAVNEGEDKDEEEVREVQPMGSNKAKKKLPSSASSSAGGDERL